MFLEVYTYALTPLGLAEVTFHQCIYPIWERDVVCPAPDCGAIT